MPDRAEVLAYAETHGATAAARKFDLPAGTVRSWRSRARKRAARSGTRVPVEQSPAERFAAEAARIVDWAERGACLACGGVGYVQVNSLERQQLAPALAAYRHSRRLVCPSCGGPRRAAVIVGTNLELAVRAAAADRDAVRAQERRDPGHPEAWA